MATSISNDVLLGAAAGVIATVPMTIVMEELHDVLPGEQPGPLPPREVSEGIYEQLTRHDDARERDMQRMTVLLHYAFGGAAGALFPLMGWRRGPEAVGAGMIYGLTVWAGNYLGLLPALGVRHNARHDSTSRNVMMIAAHVVWGATLGLVFFAKPGRVTASRHPDAEASRS